MLITGIIGFIVGHQRFLFLIKKYLIIYNDDNEELEKHVFSRLFEKDNIEVYIHEGLWDTLNTQKDEIILNMLYNDYIGTNSMLE